MYILKKYIYNVFFDIFVVVVLYVQDEKYSDINVII